MSVTVIQNVVHLDWMYRSFLNSASFVISTVGYLHVIEKLFIYLFTDSCMACLKIVLSAQNIA
jgi:hypothetical protein